ncbi:MAG: maleylpyruvate isomerase family mycothiol-dependent enzyme, partial [Syntrophales bacterium]|nr:maleylpyruvate isomerase family mycothiol-dependent enzyme [Syntrophales bacterium]
MQAICADLLTEYNELAALAETLTDEQWEMETPFYQWTPWDEIAHLCFFDMKGLLAATDPEVFAHDAVLLFKELAAGKDFEDFPRERFSGVKGRELVAFWRDRYGQLVATLAARGPKDRLPWYGPSMSTLSFATARLMETWAHGQDIYDTLRLRRDPTPRLRHVAHIGATTFGWSFANRKRPVPSPAPFIELTAPNGESWRWNEPSDTEWVKGTA